MSTEWLIKGQPILLFIFLLLTLPASAQDSRCMDCHQDRRHGQQPFHTLACVTCHGGNAQASSKLLAHQGLIAFPGNLSNVNQTCGQCHQDHVASVNGHAMTTARGMVETTRHVLGDPDDGANISQLGNSRSDSLLRKLCAGCHLGRDRDSHTHTTLNRGGGCLACHLAEYPESGHVMLTKKIADARCFGCHSRSGRISLNYAGLAEIDAAHAQPIEQKARLPDGRLVRIREPDVHHRAGMSCIDCHTLNGLMGSTQGQGITTQTVDIQCKDCHRPVLDDQNNIVTERMRSRLEHLQASRAGLQLRLKHSDRQLSVPQYDTASHPHEKEHARLSCDACHTQWAPLCYGCHIEYDEGQTQYDYLERKETPGKWIEKRWHTHNDLPPLGVDANNQIRPFVPGMILTQNHPDLDTPLFRRLFAPLTPHTSGKARSCESCHCNATALGLGSGSLTHTKSGWSFESNGPPREDGLAEDAWQHWDHPGKGASPQAGARPLNAEEIKNMLNVKLGCEIKPK